ncbi:hypothetical protein OHA77_41265 [Streptosporangium sp. NBC_01639]|uniref:hypothetical protein n=1 Tax=Streptosporangium sp. NBC_01639 TaxID=2975948 RepID=UPI00386F3D39|nr:hypothetical protein OHA77_41265 [Streptosporangium sp. NBC_01639]
MEASKPDPQIPDPQVRERAAVRRYTAAYKARILAEYDQLDKAGKGALMRREGLYSSLISNWKTARDHGVSEALARPVGRPKTCSSHVNRRPHSGIRRSGRVLLGGQDEVVVRAALA